MHRVYKGASKDHVITNVAGGKTVCLTKNGFPDTGGWAIDPVIGIMDSVYAYTIFLL